MKLYNGTLFPSCVARLTPVRSVDSYCRCLFDNDTGGRSTPRRKAQSKAPSADGTATLRTAKTARGSVPRRV